MLSKQVAPASAAVSLESHATEQALKDGFAPMHDSSMDGNSASIQPSISELMLTFLVDRVSYKDRSKPRGKEMGAIRERLALPNARVTAGIEELEGIVSGGFTIMPAICQGGTKKENWIAQQLFFLDFDNDEQMRERGFDRLEPLDAMKRAFNRKLDPLLLYFSHSATLEIPKYRMIFSLRAPVSDENHVRSIGQALLGVFPEADPASIRLTQMFLSPGKEVWPCWMML